MIEMEGETGERRRERQRGTEREREKRGRGRDRDLENARERRREQRRIKWGKKVSLFLSNLASSLGYRIESDYYYFLTEIVRARAGLCFEFEREIKNRERERDDIFCFVFDLLC